MSQLLNAEVNSGNRNAVLAQHAGMKCDLEGKHSSHCVWLAQPDSKYKSYLRSFRKVEVFENSLGPLE